MQDDIASTKIEQLKKIEEQIKKCTKCPLYESRTNAVLGEGSVNAKIMFIGEAPGRNEDLQGRPFVGQAGKLLTEALKAIGLEREEVYITNVIKCRPPNNRDPTKEEIITCTPYLEKQIDIIDPDIIVTLGKFATQFISKKYNLGFQNISKIRGEVYSISTLTKNLYILPMYHPAALLYNPKIKYDFQADFVKLKELLDKIDLH